MSTATIQYVVTGTPFPANTAADVDDSMPSVFNIYYVDQNGKDVIVANYNAPTNQFTVTFTGTVGNLYSLAAQEISHNFNTTVVVNENGSQVATANNNSNPKILAGVTGTI